MQQAQLARHDLDLRAYDLNAMVRICRLVQGMPLALVLAAGWLEVLSFREIADEIAQSLDFLESQARDMPERQRSVRATFDYSWNRLPAEERQTFIRLSVFRGGFTRQAALSVAGAGLRALRTLANKSLISVGRDERYEIHELLRQYAEEQLELAGEADRARDTHSSYYLDALHNREADLKGRRQREALDEIEVDLENIRVAWSWALRRRDVAAVDRAIESLYIFFDLHTRHQEGAECFRLAREALAPPPGEEPRRVWGRVLARLGALLSLGSDVHEAVATDVEQSLALAEKHDDLAEVAFCLFVLGKHVARGRRDFAGALSLFERSLGHYRVLGDHYYAALVLLWLGYCHGNATHLDNFHTFLHQSLDLAVATGNKAVAANVLGNLAAGAFCAGDYAAAERYCLEGRTIATEMDLRISIAHTQALLSLAHLLRGDMDQVSRLAEQALALARDIHYTTTIAFALALLGLRAAVAGDYALAERLCQESLTTPSTAFGQILARWGLAIASCGLRQHEVAWRQSRAALERAQRFSYPAMMTWPLPVAAALLAREGQTEQAVELLALAYTHPLSPTGWMQRWPLLVELRAELLADLGADVYQAAWERGEALDAAIVAARLLAPSDANGDR